MLRAPNAFSRSSVLGPSLAVQEIQFYIKLLYGVLHTVLLLAASLRKPKKKTFEPSAEYFRNADFTQLVQTELQMCSIHLLEDLTISIPANGVSLNHSDS